MTSDKESSDDDINLTSGVLRRLKILSTRLGEISFFVGLATLGHLFWAIFSILAALGITSMHAFAPNEIPGFFVAIDLIPFTISLILLYAFDKLSQRGHVYYQEISDDLEWGIDKHPSPPTNLEVRLVLREFILESTLPFYRSGKNAAIIYVIINLMLSMTVWIPNVLFYSIKGASLYIH